MKNLPNFRNNLDMINKKGNDQQYLSIKINLHK